MLSGAYSPVLDSGNRKRFAALSPDVPVAVKAPIFPETSIYRNPFAARGVVTIDELDLEGGAMSTGLTIGLLLLALLVLSVGGRADTRGQ